MNQKTPMDLLREFAPAFAANQMEARRLLFESREHQAVPGKYKLLAGIAVAAALGSATCTDMWTRMALGSGAAEDEISEIIQVARYMKMATVNDTVSSTFRILEEHGRN